MKKIFAFIILLLTFLTLYAQQTISSTPVAIVNGYKITSEFLNIMADIKRILYSINTIDQNFFNTLVNTKEGLLFLQRYRYEVLKGLIDDLLTQQLAEKYNACPAEEEVKKHVEMQINESLKRLGISLEEFEKYIADLGMTLDDLKKKFSWIYKTTKCKENLKAIITKDVAVSDEEVKDYYQKLREEFETQVTKEVSIIVTNSQEEAKSALQHLLNGESFKSVAVQFSTDKKSAKNGGYLGYLDAKKISELFGEDISKKIMKASEGVILGPYKVGVSWIIFKVGKEGKKENELEDFEKVKDEMRRKLLERKKNEYWKKWWEAEFSKFKSESNIKVNLKF